MTNVQLLRDMAQSIEQYGVYYPPVYLDKRRCALRLREAAAALATLNAAETATNHDTNKESHGL